jgi:hypothetical protein
MAYASPFGCSGFSKAERTLAESGRTSKAQCFNNFQCCVLCGWVVISGVQTRKRRRGYGYGVTTPYTLYIFMNLLLHYLLI